MRFVIFLICSYSYFANSQPFTKGYVVGGEGDTIRTDFPKQSLKKIHSSVKYYDEVESKTKTYSPKEVNSFSTDGKNLFRTFLVKNQTDSIDTFLKVIAEGRISFLKGTSSYYLATDTSDVVYSFVRRPILKYLARSCPTIEYVKTSVQEEEVIEFLGKFHSCLGIDNQFKVFLPRLKPAVNRVDVIIGYGISQFGFRGTPDFILTTIPFDYSFSPIVGFGLSYKPRTRHSQNITFNLQAHLSKTLFQGDLLVEGAPYFSFDYFKYEFFWLKTPASVYVDLFRRKNFNLYSGAGVVYQVNFSSENLHISNYGYDGIVNSLEREIPLFSRKFISVGVYSGLRFNLFEHTAALEMRYENGTSSIFRYNTLTLQFGYALAK